MARVKIRKGMPSVALDKAEFARSMRHHFYDPAFNPVQQEIALTRGVPMGQDCISPSRHSAFSTPVEMMCFIAGMRRLSGGKPTGFKFRTGPEWEFLAICKAMLETVLSRSSPPSTSCAPWRSVRIGLPI